MKIYRLQRISDGLFSTGRDSPVFLDYKYSKVWDSLKAVKTHLTRLNKNIEWAKQNGWTTIEHPYTPASNFRIVEYVVTESLSDVTSLERFYESKNTS